MSDQIVCHVEDLAPGSALRADLRRSDGAAHAVAIVRAEDGEFYALDDTCSHGAVSLSEGDVDGGEIECWGHGARFGLATGLPAALPAVVPIRVYPIRIEGDDVLVDVDAPVTLKEDA